MSADDTDHDDLEDTDDVRDRIEQEADRAVEQFDEGIVDLLAWVLDTETRARIYVHLRQQPESTSEEIAEGTGLYPSTVREALAALTEEEVVTRQKRESDGAGNNPYEYSAISPSDLVNTIVGDIQSELNTVFNLDDHIGGETTLEPDDEPVTISVEDANDDADASEDTGSDEGGSEDENDDADV
ncbi:transcriptional regulator [Haloarcula taiwanensis]|uniref:Transcriptional regulator n=1 Tax=Haloarcula taiwanensis TaxID=1932004 RepID=A0A2H4ZY25_9EURY|nr:MULTISPECIES: winged helix-turn-helix domain-containing protein [Haloarcula]AUG47340.1 transcriptional regulator [Haloarcula taiwanensis]RLM33991.1 ArsR family transcriptional regulator [Haloarcula sp. Atlit-120R]RLM42436.1 ArsR family transcriptional regulator [Haloarcula sp. Atlit-47R]